MKTKVIIIILILSSLSGFTQTKSKKTLSQTFKSESTANNVTYFEVTKKMFESLTKAYSEEPKVKEYISKLHNIKMLQPAGEKRNEKGKILYSNFIRYTNLDDFTLLMTNNNEKSKMSFLKKEGKVKNEFLLVSTDMVMYVSGTLDIGSLTELEGIIEMAGEAVGL
ncbi:MAG: DUF4252 domain-containing protein [Prolixibacteraceae bacterium]|jgi:hypothetical protein|nr:DUF4252 domain-containing protein [Prolixibacteraceae bacterium]MBT6005011.1 DUF4252 domain-containing protein [Prolixibacteraceae bacterium]MBT6764879.1 DUF4252 domain-containing protein [Prolixibacteraceae bacterium]MBT6999041.1 DUF4252 domain-containing protein [Prolixibacteraceae bacterium]MBT7394460.1 DUF4252 domain-containing protein [Prolixibacteraceae bacterium]